MTCRKSILHRSRPLLLVMDSGRVGFCAFGFGYFRVVRKFVRSGSSFEFQLQPRLRLDLKLEPDPRALILDHHRLGSSSGLKGELKLGLDRARLFKARARHFLVRPIPLLNTHQDSKLPLKLYPFQYA